MAAFKILTVGNEEYKLKLNTNATILIEDKLGGNILDGVLELGKASDIKVDEDGGVDVEQMSKIPMPSLKYCVTVLWGALQKFHHGMTFSKTCDLVDEYIEAGNTQLDLFAEIMDLLTESGILGDSKEETENLK